MAKPTADVDMHALRAEMQRALDVAAHLCDRLRQLSVPSRQLHDRLLFLLPKLPTVEPTESWVTSDAVVRYVRIVESFVALVRLSDSLSTIKHGLMQRKLVHELQGLNGEVDDVARELFTATAIGHDGHDKGSPPVSQESRLCKPTSELIRLVREGTEVHVNLALRQLRYLALNWKIRSVVTVVDVVPSLMRLIGDGDDWQKEFACRTLRNLTLDENACKRVSEEPQDVALLVEVIAKNLTDAVKEHATGVLLNLTCFDVASMKVVADCGGVAALVGLVASGAYGQKEIACGVLHNMASCVGLEAVGAFVNAIADGSEHRQAHIVGTLCVVARTRGGREAIVSLGGVDRVVDIVRSGQRGGAAESAVEMLFLLAGDPDLNGAVVDADAIDSLMVFVQNGSEKFKGSASRTLASLAQNGHVIRVGQAGTVHAMVGLLQNGTNDQRASACQLLQCLMGEVVTWNFVFDALPVTSLVVLWTSGIAEERELALDFLQKRLTKYVPVTKEYQSALVDAGLVSVLATILQSSSTDKKFIAADILHGITKYNQETKVVAAQGGLISPLVWIRGDSPMYDWCRPGMAALASLSTLAEVRAELWRIGAVETLVDILKSGGGLLVQREYLCAIFRNLSFDIEFRSALRLAELIQQLVSLFENGHRSTSCKDFEHSAVVFRNLALGSDEAKVSIVEAGGFRALYRHLCDDVKGDKSDSVAALWSLADNESRRTAIRQEHGLDWICSLVTSDEKKLDKEVGVGALLALSIGDLTNKQVILSHDDTVRELVKLVWEGTESVKSRSAAVLQSLAVDPQIKSRILGKTRATALFQVGRDCSGYMQKKLYQLGFEYASGSRKLAVDASQVGFLEDLVQVGVEITNEQVRLLEKNLHVIDELLAQPRESAFEEPSAGTLAEDSSLG